MPRSLKVATGLDALTHAIEGYITPGAWDLSDALCLRSIQMIAANLRAAADGDADAVEQMGLAAYINGMAYSNVGLGLVHGMAHPLGGRYNAPHGVANGILLAPVMAFNAEHTGEKYRDIAEAFGVEEARTMPLEEARAAAVEAVAQLTRDLGNPTRISEVGVEADGIEALADDAFAAVLLRRGAEHVVAVDVGYGQLAWSLRSDPRVTALDRTNIRTLDPEVVAPAPELVVGDLSFISLTLVLEPLLRAAADDADLLLMVKPQFEVGKDRIGHGGVVRDPELHVETVMTVAERAHSLGVGVEAVTASPLPGPAGNVEYFLSMHASRAGCPGDLSGDELRSSIEDAVAAGPAAGGAPAAEEYGACPTGTVR